MTEALTITDTRITVDRRQLLTGLTRVGWVVPRTTPKPVLQGVRLEAAEGNLRLYGTDLDIALVTSTDAEGDLPPCLVPCAELIQRVKSSKDMICTLALQDDGQRLQINNGRVTHVLNTLDLDEYPPLPAQSDGQALTLDAAELRGGLQVALRAVSTEPSRYAINGVLLESDRKGKRLVATDGRRLVVVELQRARGQFRGQVILPARLGMLVGKLIGRRPEGPVRLSVKPNTNGDGERELADLWLAGSDWMAHSREVEGHFPHYRDLVPKSHSKFVVDRHEFIETLAEVAPSRNGWNPAVRVDFGERAIRLSVDDPEVGTSSGEVSARFGGGGDAVIHTAFNHVLLMDALKALDGDRVVVDVEQNAPGPDGRVAGRPALIYGASDARIRWVVMPVGTGLPQSKETLGSNYQEPK